MMRDITTIWVAWVGLDEGHIETLDDSEFVNELEDEPMIVPVEVPPELVVADFSDASEGNNLSV